MSDNEGSVFFVGIIVGCIVMIFLMISVILPISDNTWQKDAVKHQAAYYHPETGEFTWKATLSPKSEGEE